MAHKREYVAPRMLIPTDAKFLQNGACKMFVNDMCSVYDDRPDICKVEEMAKKNNIPKEIYYKMAIDVCNNMMDEDNIPLKFRIHGI